MRVVGSLTTIPSRINGMIPTLKSLKNQTHKLDEIYLNIPKFSKKENTEYIIPEKIKKYCTILYGEDLGPITKIVATLLKEQDDNTVIITFDDDNIYDKDLVKEMLKKHKEYPNCALCNCGIIIGKFPFYFNYGENLSQQNVDILVASHGALYKRSFFPKDNLVEYLKHYLEDNDLFKNDDVLLSSMLCSKNIKRKVFPFPKNKHGKNKSNGLNDDYIGFRISLIKAIKSAEKYGLLKKRVNIVFYRSLTFYIFLIILILMIIILYIRY